MERYTLHNLPTDSSQFSRLQILEMLIGLSEERKEEKTLPDNKQNKRVMLEAVKSRPYLKTVSNVAPTAPPFIYELNDVVPNNSWTLWLVPSKRLKMIQEKKIRTKPRKQNEQHYLLFFTELLFYFYFFLSKSYHSITKVPFSSFFFLILFFNLFFCKENKRSSLFLLKEKQTK